MLSELVWVFLGLPQHAACREPQRVRHLLASFADFFVPSGFSWSSNRPIAIPLRYSKSFTVLCLVGNRRSQISALFYDKDFPNPFLLEILALMDAKLHNFTFFGNIFPSFSLGFVTFTGLTAALIICSCKISHCNYATIFGLNSSLS